MPPSIGLRPGTGRRGGCRRDDASESLPGAARAMGRAGGRIRGPLEPAPPAGGTREGPDASGHRKCHTPGHGKCHTLEAAPRKERCDRSGGCQGGRAVIMIPFPRSAHALRRRPAEVHGAPDSRSSRRDRTSVMPPPSLAGVTSSPWMSHGVPGVSGSGSGSTLPVISGPAHPPACASAGPPPVSGRVARAGRRSGASRQATV